MTTRAELERLEVPPETITIACRGCARPVRLHFNGGELDREECCGYLYETVHTRIDLVVSRLT